MRKIPLILALALSCLFASSLRADEMPLVFSDDFSKGIDAWEPTDAKAWKITEIDGNPAF